MPRLATSLPPASTALRPRGTPSDEAPNDARDEEDDSDDGEPDEAFHHETKHTEDDAKDKKNNDYSNHGFDATPTAGSMSWG
jgi:hypothetical protein